MKKRRFLWLLLWIGSLVMISLKGGTISYGFFFFFTGLPVVSFLYLMVCLAQFRIYQALQTRVVTAGTPVTYFFVLENAGILPISSIMVEMFPDFSYVEELPSKTAFLLLPGESFRFETKMVCKYRGNYQVGVSCLVISDFLNLFRIRYRLKSPFEAIVNVRVPEENEVLLPDVFSVWQRNENRSRKDEPDPAVRDYEAGDGFRYIHWNASAATGSLKVRTMTGEQQGEVVLFFDATRCYEQASDYLPVENKVLETTLYFSQHFSSLSQTVTIFYRDEEPLFLHQLSDFESVLEKLQTVEFLLPEAEADPVSAFFDSHPIADGQRVILILQDISEADGDLFRRLLAGGVDLFLCLISDQKTLPEGLSQIPVLSLSPFFHERRSL